jgi:uroporphyrinogen decarboxylase
MKVSLGLSAVLLTLGSSSAFSPSSKRPTRTSVSASVEEATASSLSTTDGSHQDPLLIRAARGEKVERTPVWMMRQAGRHIAEYRELCKTEYRELCKTYPTFRQRSEIPDVAVEVSLQPWRNYQTDGCILFSDILTPLPGMGCEFVIDEKKGPVMAQTIDSWDKLDTIHGLDPSSAAPFVAETLKILRQEVGPETAVLGFVGCPYTLATYLVEGKSSKEYLEIKKMALNEPQLLHAILQKLADNIGDYALYQIENGAQLIQM